MAHLYGAADGRLIAVIGDEDTVTGMLLAGIGDKSGADGPNYFVVDAKTKLEMIEATFNAFVAREDIAILLINQPIANQIRHLLSIYKKKVPTVLEIPSKDCPYDPQTDSVLKRVHGVLGSG